MTGKPPLWSRRLTCALAVAAAVALPAPANASGAEVVAQVVDRLEAANGQTVEGLSPTDILLRNLSRYFATYPVATERDELGLVLGLAEELARRHVWGVLGAAVGGLPPGGAIDHDRIEAAALGRLPRRPTPYDEVVYLPHLPEGERTAVEIWDLRAFEATDFGWQTLLSLAAELEAAALPTVAPEAVERLAHEAAVAGLLVLRRAGERARRELAPELTSAQVREAAARLEAILSGDSPPAAAEPPRDGASDPAPGLATPFTDVTESAALRFRHVSSDWLARWRRFGPLAPTFSGGGVAAGDLDGDGWADLVLCGGRGCRVFLNRGDRRFEEASDRYPVAPPCEARTPLVVDFDNDGIQDLFVTCAREPDQLFRGLPEGGLEAAGQGAGLGGAEGIDGPATAFDADGDARLDLYVGRFGDYLARESPFQAGDNKNGLPDRLYRNLGDLRFEETGESAGVGNRGWAQAVSHADLDLDGDQDVYVANDFGRNDLLLNRGDGTFLSAGAATGADDPFHGMNVAFTDLNRDQRPDIFVTNIWSLERRRLELVESNTLLLSEAGSDPPRFTRFASSELEAIDTGWSWSALFVDFDLDGDDDLFLANGFTDYWTTTQMRPHPERPGDRYWINNGREANLLLENVSGLPVRPIASGAEMPGANARGLALVDFDLDGDQDLAVTAFHGAARLFRNDAATAGRSLAVDLVGSPAAGSSRDAIGAVLLAHTGGGATIWRHVAGGEGYLSMSHRTVHFGLGEAATATLDVRWPGGGRQRFERLPAGTRLTLFENSASTGAMPEPTAPVDGR